MRKSLLLALSLVTSLASAQDPRLTSALQWRNLGPFRAGRVAAVTGAMGIPGTFYIGAPGGGVWKTTSAGETWYPIFDAVKDVYSIGAVEVAPSDPNVVYVGTGDIVTGGSISEGNGVWKSLDAGVTWRHLGLPASKQIPSMLVDETNPNIVLVAAQGDIHVKSHDRGIFRSTDGGATWTQTLFVNDSTGAQKIARAWDTPNVLYVTTVAHYTAPPTPPVAGGPPGGGFGQPQTGETNSKIFKSTDGGVTWTEIKGNGLPARMTGKIWVAAANKTNGQRVFVIGDWGLYRSDDAGATWHQMAADDNRIRNGQGGYNCGVYVDSNDPDRVYTINTSSYVSTDGGQHFTGFKGAPGGDDPQQMWIDPQHGERIMFGYDQGAIVSLDRGATWSSWYNQSTEQIYHLTVDNSFPYYVYGTQQDAGAIRTRSRGNLGAITPLDWNPIPGWEWGSIAVDPLDNNTVYSTGSGVVRISLPSETWIDVGPSQDPALKLRSMQDWPIRFAPWNPKMLVVGFNQIMTSVDAGAHWTSISPDLAARDDRPAGAPATGAAQSLALSTTGQQIIWVGTNTGLIKVTRNGGKSWSDATIPGLPFAWRAEVFSIEASHTDPAEAYAAIDIHRSGDYAPYIYRTKDFGKTWAKTVTGLPTNQVSGSFARFVREDTKRKGLLFAGTESGVYVSFDDGDHWQSLQNNLPATSVRDAVIKDDDLIITTYGRGFWALDDISALRQMTAATASEPVHLYKPGNAARVRRNPGADTPFPPEVPHALNPLPGAQIDYWLGAAPSSDITLEITDASGAFVRRFTSAPGEPVPEAARPPHPNFWVAPPAALPKNAGANRYYWAARYGPPNVFSHSFEINANPGLTPASPLGPLVLPGTYTLTLTANGAKSTQTVTITPDPRSPANPAALAAQHALQMKIMQGLEASFEGHRIALALRDALRGAIPAGAAPEMSDAQARVTALLARLDTIGGLDASRRGGRGGGGNVAPSFTSINNALAGQLNSQESGDAAPSQGALAAFAATCKELSAVSAAWTRATGVDLDSLNTVIVARGRTRVALPAGVVRPPTC